MLINVDGMKIIFDKDRVITYLLQAGWKRNMKHEGFFRDPQDPCISVGWSRALDLQRERDIAKVDKYRHIRNYLDKLERDERRQDL